MAKTLKPIIYGAKKDITLEKYNVGKLLEAITYDLEEDGVKGVQGLVVKGNDATSLVNDAKKSKKPAEPYVIAGSDGKDMYFQIRCGKDTKFVEEVKIVSGYESLKEELKKKSNAVINIDPGGDKGIVNSAKAQGERLGTTPKDKVDDADIGTISGHIMLIAHGTPKTLPGRVIGTKLGRKTPQQIVDMLTGSDDKAKRIGKDYADKIYLAGCFTASGGPESELNKQDDPFAKQVLDLLRNKGYKKLSVVGYPGATTTTQTTFTDGHGTPTRKGEEKVTHAMEDDEGLKADMEKLDKLTTALDEYYEKYKGDPASFANDPMTKKLVNAIDAQQKITERNRDKRTIASLEGNFGLRKIKEKPWYKKLFS